MVNPLNKQKMEPIDWLFYFLQITFGMILIVSIILNTNFILEYASYFSIFGILAILCYFIVAHKHNKQFKIIEISQNKKGEMW